MKKDFLYVLIGQLILAATNWLATVILAKGGGAIHVGIYSTAVSIGVPIIAVSQLALRSVLITDRRDRYSFGEYLALRIISVIISALIIIGIASFGAYALDIRLAIIGYSISPALDSIADIYQVRLQRSEKVRYYGISMTVRGILNLALFASVYLATKSVVAALFASAISSLLVLLVYDRQLAIRFMRQEGYEHDAIRMQFTPDRLVQLSREALPLGVSASLATINGYLSRLFAVGYLPLNQVGIFSTINYIMNLGIQVSISISAVIMPKLTRHWDESLHKDFNRILLKSLISNLVLGLVGILFAVFFGQRFLMVVFGPEFAQYSDVLVITMVAGTLMYISQPITNAVTAMREFKIQIWASVSVVAASIVCGFYLLPRYGIRGAAYMGLITMAVRLLAWIITFLLARRRHLGLISA